MKDFRQLKVWEEAHRLALLVYRLTGTFPKEELYGMVSQLRRASFSIPANLAEGCGRDGDKELARFVQIAMGSACELEYFLLLARDLRMLSDAQHSEANGTTVAVKKMLASLLRRLRATSRV
ncbi:MAG TPA: four helix bundle protein [Phycisphaerales bacterium]|nr:four helix bundle protein [Phycisphaerales bacterium]